MVIVLTCSKCPRLRAAHRWCSECQNAYRRDRRAAGKDRRTAESVAARNARRRVNPEFKVKRATQQTRRRRANPEQTRACRIADKHRRRGAPSDPATVLMLLRDPCAYCGADAATIDHIVPLIGGGDGAWENLAPSCRSCNSRKSSKPLLLFMAQR